MNIQWYPGHMTKAVREMKEDIKLVDLIIEIVDARVPVSSRNPDIQELGKNKSRMIVLNKADLSDEKENQRWMEYFKSQGYYIAAADSRRSQDMKSIQNAIRLACKEKKERDLKRGIKNRPVRAMVAGIPNVGKSTFINSFAGKACTKTGNRPGVTRGKQWIRMNKEVELLDTPGILWPRFEDQRTGVNLASIGSIKDDILNIEELCLGLIRFLVDRYPGRLQERYGLEGEKDEALSILEAVGRNRGCLKKQDEIDTEKAAALILDDFRSGRLGRITLEPVEVEKALENNP